jgi:peptide/nickel transport system substrate-binding protein
LKGGAAFSVGAAALALIGCGGDDNGSEDSTQPTPAGNASAGEPIKGGRFKTVQASTSAHYNLYSNYQEGYNLSGIRVYDRPITRRMDSRNYVLEAAESVETPSETKIVLKLKQGMVFQNLPPVNGRAVKASDIVAGQEYVKALSTAENNGFQKQYVDKVEATDDRTVVYTLKTPYAYAFASVNMCNPTAMAIVPAELLAGNMETQTPVGSGAYQQAEAQINTRYLYRRNPTYRDAAKGLPYIDEHEVILLIDPTAIEAAYRGGQLDRWNNPPSATVDGMIKDLGNKIADEKYLSTGLFISNMRLGKDGGKAPWNDVRVREAFYRASDRQQVADLVFQGKAVVPNGPMHASLSEYQLDKKDTDQYYKKDIQAAKQLLQAANFPFDKEFEISINNSPNNNTAGEVWSTQMLQAGVKLRPTPIAFAEWLPNRIGKGDFDLVIGATPGADTPYRAMRQHHGDTLDIYNWVGLNDPTINALIEKSEQATNKDENIKLVKEVQIEALKKYSGSYNWITQQVSELRNTKIQNYESDILFGQLFRQNWWFAA